MWIRDARERIPPNSHLSSGKNWAFSPAMRSICLLLITCLLFCTAPVRAADPQPTAASGEFIVLTGGVSLWIWEKWKASPHDNWWMNFVRASRIRIEQIEQQPPGAQVPWLVYRPAYLARAKQ